MPQTESASGHATNAEEHEACQRSGIDFKSTAMSELVTPRPTQSADAADDEFESPLTSSPVRPQRRPMRLLAAVASQSPSHLAPRGGLFLPSSAVTTVVRGMRNRFIFGTAASAGPAANEAVPPSITPARTMDEMWSPGASHSSGGEALRRERRMHQPLERNVRGLFCRAEPPTTGKENYDVCQVANSSKKQPAPPASPLPATRPPAPGPPPTVRPTIRYQNMRLREIVSEC